MSCGQFGFTLPGHSSPHCVLNQGGQKTGSPQFPGLGVWHISVQTPPLGSSPATLRSHSPAAPHSDIKQVHQFIKVELGLIDQESHLCLAHLILEIELLCPVLFSFSF